MRDVESEEPDNGRVERTRFDRRATPPTYRHVWHDRAAVATIFSAGAALFAVLFALLRVAGGLGVKVIGPTEQDSISRAERIAQIGEINRRFLAESLFTDAQLRESRIWHDSTTRVLNRLLLIHCVLLQQTHSKFEPEFCGYPIEPTRRVTP